jgi:purine-binding chemotaxis protein CheW
MDETFHFSAERAQQIMDARADAIGQALDDTAATAPRIELLTLSLANERFALETRFVREVAALPSVTPVPGTPSYVRGVANLRGEILAIIDLGRFFGLETQDRTNKTRIVVLGDDRTELAILADEVREVVSLPLDALAGACTAAIPIAEIYLLGVTTDALIALDTVALLEDPRLFVDHSCASSAALEKR